MAKKIYIDTTGELVIDALEEGGTAVYIPAFSEITRIKHLNDALEIRYSYASVKVVLPTSYTKFADESGTAYPTFAALWLALDPYFSN